MWRSRWAAVGAAIAVSLGAGGVGLVNAISTGERPVTVTVDPERIVDTRVDLGLIGPFTSGAPRNVQVTGSVPVASGGTATVLPTDAVAVLVNITVVNPSAGGFLSLRPGGAAGDPDTSTVNFDAGSIEPNAATVDLGPGGTVQVWVQGATAHVLIDVVGYTIDHDHDDRYYTETEVDAALSSKADAADLDDKVDKGPVTYSQGPSAFTKDIANNAVTSLEYNHPAAVASADGVVGIGLVGPAEIGGQSLTLQSVTYCITGLSPGAKVDAAEIDAHAPDAFVLDLTDRTAPGCYTVLPSAQVQQGRTFQLLLLLDATGSGDVGLQGVTTTWGPRPSPAPPAGQSAQATSISE